MIAEPHDFRWVPIDIASPQQARGRAIAEGVILLVGRIRGTEPRLHLVRVELASTFDPTITGGAFEEVLLVGVAVK